MATTVQKFQGFYLGISEKDENNGCTSFKHKTYHLLSQVKKSLLDTNLLSNALLQTLLEIVKHMYNVIDRIPHFRDKSKGKMKPQEACLRKNGKVPSYCAFQH